MAPKRSAFLLLTTAFVLTAASSVMVGCGGSSSIGGGGSSSIPSIDGTLSLSVGGRSYNLSSAGIGYDSQGLSKQITSSQSGGLDGYVTIGTGHQLGARQAYLGSGNAVVSFTLGGTKYFAKQSDSVTINITKYQDYQDSSHYGRVAGSFSGNVYPAELSSTQSTPGVFLYNFTSGGTALAATGSFDLPIVNADTAGGTGGTGGTGGGGSTGGHYSGTYSTQVAYLLTRFPSGTVVTYPSSATDTSAQVPDLSAYIDGPCTRDQYIAAAIAAAWGAEAQARIGNPTLAQKNADTMMSVLGSALDLCGNGPTFEGNGTCATTSVVTCAWLSSNTRAAQVKGRGQSTVPSGNAPDVCRATK